MFDSNWEMISGPDAREIEVLNATNQLNVLDGLVTLLLAHKGPFGNGNAPMPDDAAFCELHRAGTLFLLAQPGCYRNLEVQVRDVGGVITLRPPQWQMVPALMQRFYRELSSVWTTGDAVDVAAYALWCINWIHPFRNGNGRTARAFSYACLCLKLGVRLPGQPTVIDQLMARRADYEGALKVADNSVAAGNLPDLGVMKILLNELLQIQISNVAPP